MNVIAFDPIGTITITPSTLMTNIPLEVYNHEYFGEHELKMTVFWVDGSIIKQINAFSSFITKRVAVEKTFKV